jgi:hypothetical protein
LLFNISRPQRLIELSKVTETASRTLPENSRFTAAEGAAGHCESLGRSTFNVRAFDWLDQVFFGSDGRVA